MSTAPANVDTTAGGRHDGVAALELRNVHTFYGHIHAIKDISLKVMPNEIVSLIGANGAGKTTTLKTISGIQPAREGEVLLNGQRIEREPAHRIVQMGVCQSPEGRRIFSRMTVLENLQMGAIVANDPANFDKDLEHVYTLFPLLKARQFQRGGTLSGGEQQMLAIGRALMGRPTLLLLDEPSLARGRPKMVIISVVLPAPLPPISVTISPCLMSRLTPCRIGSRP